MGKEPVIGPSTAYSQICKAQALSEGMHRSHTGAESDRAYIEVRGRA